MRPAALVTGASGGIGEAMARMLAKRGHDLHLVARSRERLEALAAELRGAHGIEVLVQAEDLANVGAAERVITALERSSLDLAVVVNNAGIGLHGAVSEIDPEEQTKMVMLNVVALQRLTSGLLPILLRRPEGGRILQVGSTAGMQPVPYMACYAATKAFVINYSTALADELRGTKVTVTALCPGPTETGFAAASGVQRTRLFSRGTTTAEEVARAGLEGMEAGRAVVIPGAKNRMLAFGGRFMPRAVLMRISRSLMREEPALGAR